MMDEPVDSSMYAAAVRELAIALKWLGYYQARGDNDNWSRHNRAASAYLETILNFHRQIAVGLVTTQHVDAFGHILTDLRRQLERHEGQSWLFSAPLPVRDTTPEEVSE